MKAVELKNVSLAYEKDTQILNRVSFSIEEGEFVSLVGANGTGKSSIAKIIMGLVTEDSGSVKVFDIEKNSKNTAEIRSFSAYIFQNPDNQFIGNTVADDVAFRLENNLVPQKDMDSIIDNVLKDVGMTKFKHYEPQLLSGGQKQRVAIAANLVCPLKLIIFDESTSMIDPEGREEVISSILKIKKENPNMTILYITHNMEETLMSDRVLVLDNGTIAYDGTPKSLFLNDELLSKFKLKEPFKFELYKKLNSIGIKVNLDDSIEEIAKKICQ